MDFLILLVSIISGIILLVLGGLFYYIATLGKRLATLASGKQGNSPPPPPPPPLESTITQALENIKELQTENIVLHKEIESLHQRLLKTVQEPPVKRFNAFTDAGGNQSFATAFVTENGDGVVLSTIYSREKTSVFAKHITKYTATQELSAEEQEVLDNAKIAYEKK
jgi:hypothetical protein